MQVTSQVKTGVQGMPQYQKQPEMNEISRKNLDTKQPHTSENALNPQTNEKEKVEAQIDGINKVLESNMTSLKFNLHEETNRYYVEVQDQKTKEVIKEIPSKEFLDLMARITEYSGILMDTKI
ncbi:flagellar protein FlaG [Bacillus sp. FJAT-29937]|uniref:flagellar protein FlaG n=1 Tax=Bacillus sp. FJAT-29937 TaxID=1720553 RepID=UPI0008372A09|nr:flagellar protein FlaG [Bacillus sp. FJAT-29937]